MSKKKNQKKSNISIPKPDVEGEIEKRVKEKIEAHQKEIDQKADEHAFNLVQNAKYRCGKCKMLVSERWDACPNCGCEQCIKRD